MNERFCAFEHPTSIGPTVRTQNSVVVAVVYLPSSVITFTIFFAIMSKELPHFVRFEPIIEDQKSTGT